MNPTRWVVRDSSGTEYGAPECSDLVKLMRMDTFLPVPTNVRFKKVFARRIETVSGKTIRYVDAESFIEELARIGYLEIVRRPGDERRRN
jgi:hypothetical protein